LQGPTRETDGIIAYCYPLPDTKKIEDTLSRIYRETLGGGSKAGGREKRGREDAEQYLLTFPLIRNQTGVVFLVVKTDEN